MFFSSGWGDQVRCGGYPLKSGHTHPNVQLCLKSVATNPRTTHNQQRFSSLQSSKMYMWSFISLSSRILCQIFLVNTIIVLGAHTTDCWLCLGILAHVTEWQWDFSFSLQIKKPGWGLRKQNWCFFITSVEESTSRVLQGGNPLTSQPVSQDSGCSNSTAPPWCQLPRSWAAAAGAGAGCRLSWITQGELHIH